MEDTKREISKLREEVFKKFDMACNCNTCDKLKHILLIDDDDISNFVTRKTLECYEVVSKISVYDNPEEALDFLQTLDQYNIPEIILLDIKMPLMNGFEFIEKYNKKKLTNKSKIILLSSSAYSRDKEKAKAKGIDYISKPITLNSFQSKF